MNVLKYQKIKRRDLLSWVGSAALALPFLELFEGNARAQAAKKSKYAVFCYTPDGVNQGMFWPTGTETNFTLSPILTPFAPYKDKMLILGPQMNGTMPKAGAGLAYAGPTPQHQAPVCLTARVGTGCGKVGVFCAADPNFGLPYTADQTKADNRINGPSIDQVIATAVQAESLFSSLNFGMHPIGGDTPSDLNYAMDGTPLKRMASADEAWNRMFGTAMGTGPDALAAQAASDLRMHNAVSDFLHARVGSLRPILSANDRRTLDGHLSALRTFEDRKAKLLMAKANSTVTCKNPTRAMVPTDADSVRTGADTQFLSPFFMDMIATAFTCNMTKVASVTFGYPGGGDAGGLRMPWLGFSEALHAISHHGGNPVNMDKYQKMNTWIAGQVAGLMQRLAAVPTGTGTLLDDTTIYWFNRHGDGNPHSNFALPNIILGGTGGYFKMGRYLQLPATSPTKVLISIANAMGVNVPTFGEKALVDTAALSGIAA
ncbi:MAG TPA: DUF1552 domain-containing protein [Polyangia bacterium]|nr:DUF1552 domain-containing protein [Polyangia bacterium]